MPQMFTVLNGKGGIMKRYMGFLVLWAVFIGMSGYEGGGTKQAVGTALGGTLGGRVIL